jgi:hypothetical protein
MPWVDQVPRAIESGTAEAGTTVDAYNPFEQKIREEIVRQAARTEAAKRLKAVEQCRLRIEILDRTAQTLIPRPVPLLAGWLGQGHTARIFGPPGSGKSFAAVDLAACVSLGKSWHGYQVAQGEVIYFAVEDAAGVAMRLRAWERHHDTEHQVHMVSTPVRMDGDTVGRVVSAIGAYFGHARSVRLIVLDTQAMVTVGLDENSAQDMGTFVEAIKLLAAQTGACVLVVHHSGVRGGRARGSSTVLGAVDVELEVSKVGATITVASVKQKNVAHPPPLLVSMHVIELGELDELGQPVTSCVLLAAGDTTGPFTSPIMPPIPALHRRALAIAAVLSETNATGETYARVRTRASQMTDFGMTPATVTSAFSKAWAFLIGRGRVSKMPGREAYYFIDLEGLDRLAMNEGKKVQGGPEIYDGE